MLSCRRHRSTPGTLALVVAVIATTGCASAVPSSESAESGEPVARVATAVGDAARRPAHPPPPDGPAILLVAALHELDTLSDAQRAKIQGAIDSLSRHRDAPAGRGDHAAIAALAAGVRAGQIDESAVLAKVESEPSGTDEHRAALASALSTLHETLDTDQRRVLVDRIAARMEAERGGPMPAPGAGEPPRPPPDLDRRHDRRGPPMGSPPGMGPGPLGFLLEGVGLSDAQRASIRKALEGSRPSEAERDAAKRRFEAIHATINKRLAGFAEDPFDANAFVTPPEGASVPRERLQHIVREVRLIVPILEAKQREALAALIEKGPPAGRTPGRPR